MKITAIAQQKGPGRRVDVEVDGEVRFSLAEEVRLREGLHTGAALDADRIRELEALDAAWRVREAAYQLLSHRPRTERELRQRLLRKNFSSELVEGCVGELREKGLLDDSAYARGFLRDRVRLKPKGPGLLAGELRARGIGESAAVEAVAEVMETEEVTELDLARAAIRRWSPRPGEETSRARRRLYGYLARRGFSPETIRELVDERIA